MLTRWRSKCRRCALRARADEQASPPFAASAAMPRGGRTRGEGITVRRTDSKVHRTGPHARHKGGKQHSRAPRGVAPGLGRLVGEAAAEAPRVAALPRSRSQALFRGRTAWCTVRRLQAALCAVSGHHYRKARLALDILLLVTSSLKK